LARAPSCAALTSRKGIEIIVVLALFVLFSLSDFLL
jgi:hypothetical protein